MNLSNRYVSATGDGDMSDLPRRTLPPGNVSRLFDMYKAEGGKSKYGTFRCCWKKTWLPYLKFAVPSDHGVCDDCFALKNGIADATGPASKFTALSDYRAHISDVSRDRDVKDEGPTIDHHTNQLAIAGISAAFGGGHLTTTPLNLDSRVGPFNGEVVNCRHLKGCILGVHTIFV